LRVAGFDENGLGPRFGPLVVTGVLLEISGEGETLLANHPGPVDDSKRIFRRDPVSYARGEAIALAILAGAGIEVEDTDTLRKGLDLPADLPLPEGGLPIWCSGREPQRLGPQVLGVETRTIAPATLNETNKFNHTVSCMVELGQGLMPIDLCLLGKVGGRKFYGSFLWNTFGEELTTMREEPAESRYEARGTQWRFARDADAIYLPVAMASVVGKYLRELVMLELNARAGFSSRIPYCSGYPGDPRTPELARALSDRADPWSIPREH
jgi:ribonuclease HII